MSIPGTPEQKKTLIECMSCHTLERIVRSTYNADEFVPVLKRMAQLRQQHDAGAHAAAARRAQGASEDWCARSPTISPRINLSGGPTWSYPLKTLPRPTGAATHVIVTEYDLPRQTIAPHDVRTDAQGNVWYSDFGEQDLGELDPQDRRAPGICRSGAKAGLSDRLARSRARQRGQFVARDDVPDRARQVRHEGEDLSDLPGPGRRSTTTTTQQSMVMPRHWQRRRQGLDQRRRPAVDPAARPGDRPIRTDRSVQESAQGPPHSPYGMVGRCQNNLYFMDFGDENIGRIDAKTGEATHLSDADAEFAAAPRHDRRPGPDVVRRIRRQQARHVRHQDGGVQGMERADAAHLSYDVSLDRKGELWSGGMASDRVLRFDPPSGASVEYLLPRPTNIRRVFVDNTTNPATFWAGNNHGAEILRVEPLD